MRVPPTKISYRKKGTLLLASLLHLADMLIKISQASCDQCQSTKEIRSTLRIPELRIPSTRPPPPRKPPRNPAEPVPPKRFRRRLRGDSRSSNARPGEESRLPGGTEDQRPAAGGLRKEEPDTSCFPGRPVVGQVVRHATWGK